jgi:hypothetical protein
VENLVVLSKDSSGNCILPGKNLTKLTTAGSYARDFSVSPDGSMVAFIQLVAPPTWDASTGGTAVGGSLYLVPTDGSQAPHAVGGVGELYAFYGARWIAGGTHLAWNGTFDPPDANFGTVDASAVMRDGGLPAMNVIPVNMADGGGLVHVAQSDPANETYVFGGGNGGGCSFSLSCSVTNRGAGPAAGLALSGLLCGVFFLRRRARKADQRDKK